MFEKVYENILISAALMLLIYVHATHVTSQTIANIVIKSNWSDLYFVAKSIENTSIISLKNNINNRCIKLENIKVITWDLN